MSKNFNELPIELIKQIDKTVEEAINKKFLIDPLLGKKRSLEQSIHGSLVKRHGLIIQNAIETAFKQSSHHTVIDSKGFKISIAAERLTEYKPHDLGRLPDLVHFPGNGRITLPDLIVIDHRTGAAIALEEKRAHGPSDAGKKSQIIRDIQCLRMNVRSFVEQKGYHVTQGDAKIIEYYGRSGLPKELTLNSHTIDDFFGIHITDLVEASTEYLRRKISTVLPKKLNELAA